MKRRSLLKLGAFSAATLAIAGAGVALTTQAGFAKGALSMPAREVAEAVARAVLDGRLPQDDAVRRVALQAHVTRLEAAISNFPRAVQDEIGELFMILSTSVGRWALAGVPVAWSKASVAQIQAGLQSMRVSPISVRAQAYQALRDLTHGAYYADASTWADMRYPGPKALA